MKLFVTDLDGSLLNDNKEIPSNFNEVLNKIEEKNYHFAIATGRSHQSVAKEFKNYINRISIVSNNGSSLHIKNKLINSIYVDDKYIKTCIDIFLKVNKGILTLTGLTHNYIMYSDNYSKDEQEEVHRYFTRIDTITSFNEVKDKINKISVCCDNAHDLIFPNFTHLDQEIDIIISGKYWIDISKIGQSKGKMIIELQNHLNINKDNTYCFGDYLNDQSMCEATTNTYAMDNAHQDLFNIFTYRIGNNNDESVTNKILELID